MMYLQRNGIRNEKNKIIDIIYCRAEKNYKIKCICKMHISKENKKTNNIYDTTNINKIK